MKITCDPKSVRITAGQNNRLATASITLDNAFVVRNISVMNGSKGIFVNMPSQKGVGHCDNQHGNSSGDCRAYLRYLLADTLLLVHGKGH